MSWFYYALLSAVFAALTAIFAKIGLQGINSDFATFIRSLMIVFIIALWLSYLGKWQPVSSISAKQWLFLFCSAAATGFSWLFYFKALQIGQAAQVAPVDKLSVVFVALFAVLFLGERLTWRECLGVMLIVCGVILLSIKPNPVAKSADVQAAQSSK